ncbi:MAG TPA: hypothetical protein VGR14_13025 [Verrucomicrobiae bacterium]|nr:hypothetical protein [Verrucomicrobiae bacterium]
MGRNDSNHGPFFVDDETIASLPANQRSIGRERAPIGFEHNIDEGSDEYKRTSEPRAIAGMATVEGVLGKGIFLSAIGWSKTGADNIGYYEDLSPTPLFDKTTRRVLAIASASLTRTGSVYGLTLENAASVKLSAALLSPRGEADPSLKGFSRTVDAFERENALHRQAETIRLAAGNANRISDNGLTGFDRLLAALEEENRLHREADVASR